MTGRSCHYDMCVCVEGVGLGEGSGVTILQRKLTGGQYFIDYLANSFISIWFSLKSL